MLAQTPLSAWVLKMADEEWFSFGVLTEIRSTGNSKQECMFSTAAVSLVLQKRQLSLMLSTLIPVKHVSPVRIQMPCCVPPIDVLRLHACGMTWSVNGVAVRFQTVITRAGAVGLGALVSSQVAPVL